MAAQGDDRVSLSPLDPVKALKALLAVEPDSAPATVEKTKPQAKKQDDKG